MGSDKGSPYPENTIQVPVSHSPDALISMPVPIFGALVLRFRNNARVCGTRRPAKTACFPSPNWRGNCGAQHLVAGVTYEQRDAAYAVIRNRVGSVIAVHVPAGYWLPGGGSLPGETPEETVVREVREELGCALRLLGTIGQAVQYFFAASEERYYMMQAVFFRAALGEGSRGPAESAWCWLDISPAGPLFFHACHDWAVRQG